MCAYKKDIDVLAIAKSVLAEESKLLGALREQLGQSFVELVQLLAECKGHVLITGAGTSRYIAERFAHLLSCCGKPSLFIHPSDSLHGGAGAITPHDIFFAISKGGETDEVNKLAEIAKIRGAEVVALTEKENSTLGKISDYALIIKAGNIDPYGVIATGSSIANAAVTDALCVALLKLSGYTLEDFALTHPAGAVGKRLLTSETESHGEGDSK